MWDHVLVLLIHVHVRQGFHVVQYCTNMPIVAGTQDYIGYMVLELHIQGVVVECVVEVVVEMVPYLVGSIVMGMIP